MTAAAIISQLASEAWLRQAAKNIAGEYADDLYQEFFLLLLEKPAEEIVKVYTNGYIKFYSIKIMGRIFKGRALGMNGFAKFLPSDKYVRVNNMEEIGRYYDYLERFGVDDGKAYIDVPEQLKDTGQQQTDSFDFERAKEIENEVLASCYWFDAHIYRMYRSGMSRKKIYRETKIDARVVSATIDKVKKQLEERYYAD